MELLSQRRWRASGRPRAMPPFAVGAMVEAEKWPGSWYRAKITAVVGDGASYDVE